MSTKKAVVLLSGGLDSSTVLAHACAHDYDCYALSFSYNQRHSSELEAAKNIANHFSVKEHKIFDLDIAQFGGSSLTSRQIPVPDYSQQNHEKKLIPTTYVPARNTIFLSVALGWAEVIAAQKIFIGVSGVDYSGYPDCRPEFIASYNKLSQLATKAGVSGQAIVIDAPLINLSKSQTIQMGIEYGLDYALTISCYQATDSGAACGRCDSCVLRKKGFAAAGVLDPTIYA